MNINWKARFKNGAWLMTFISMIVVFVYDILGQLEIVPAIPKDSVLQLVKYALYILAALGVVTDPTTKGIGDSDRAQWYTAPWDDAKDNGGQTPVNVDDGSESK